MILALRLTWLDGHSQIRVLSGQISGQGKRWEIFIELIYRMTISD